MTDYQFDIAHTVSLPSGKIQLDGILQIPQQATGIVLFVHGSGSSRFSKRNQFVATELHKANLATLLFDLLTPEEERIDNMTRELRFDIEFLASRLLIATDWVLKTEFIKSLPIGYFGASTGGGAAIVAAAKQPPNVKAVVSRGGRPDLAGEALVHITVPTLLIVGGDDTEVITMNQNAMAKMKCLKKMEIVPGATHLFEEPGTLDEVAKLTSRWFDTYLSLLHRP